MLKHTIAMAAMVAGLAGPAAAEMIEKTSPKSVAETMDALEAAVTEAGATVFARVDHAAGAASVDMELDDAQLLIFGNPRLGTLAMQADMLAGLQLPLRVLVYDSNAGTIVAYESVDQMFDGLDVPLDAEFVENMRGALRALTGKAVTQ
ncbi:DUF302 domain-containing protein [Yoonia sp. 208BN28-4]|uniref:DUF302 domain-containing protein n=1 Tax=Yoonia sp. 208BN28-4 TaxID=3126505 RepID=UPI0030A3D48B